MTNTYLNNKTGYEFINPNINELLEINQNINFNYKLYERTNEDLYSLLKNINIKNKEVLSVLASSDQLIASYYFGAKNVDAFDRNLMTIYYFYLRKWYFNETKRKYPKLKDLKILDLINKVETNNKYEVEAKKFWLLYFKDIFNTAYVYELFEYSPYNMSDTYLTIDSLNKSFNTNLNFYNINILDDININKKYDIIILSNMIEYIHANKKDLLIIRNNLEKLLNTNGQVICSLLINKKNDDNFKIEKDILTSNNLNFNVFYDAYEPLIGNKRCIGYSYKLKKN